jgi:hypothetical protein
VLRVNSQLLASSQRDPGDLVGARGGGGGVKGRGLAGGRGARSGSVSSRGQSEVAAAPPAFTRRNRFL